MTNSLFCELVGIPKQLKNLHDIVTSSELEAYPIFTEDNENFKNLFFLRFDEFNMYLAEMILTWHEYYYSTTLHESFVKQVIADLQSTHVDDDWKQVVIQRIQEQDWQV